MLGLDLFSVSRFINRFLAPLGLRISKSYKFRPTGIEDQAWDAMKVASGRTMGIPVQQYSMWQASRYVVENDIEGEIAEFGVWRGGMSLISAMALTQTGSQKEIYLFDTFMGMTQPTEFDYELLGGNTALKMLRNEKKMDGKINTWAYASLRDVQDGFKENSFPVERLHFVKGDVSDTVPMDLPERIALCRIDTDWYESTKHVISHAWPRLSDYGVLILDDYDVWSGSREAVDDYFNEIGYRPLATRIDSGRLIIKLPNVCS